MVYLGNRTVEGDLRAEAERSLDVDRELVVGRGLTGGGLPLRRYVSVGENLRLASESLGGRGYDRNVLSIPVYGTEAPKKSVIESAEKSEVVYL